MRQVKALILDWAGTTIDYGSMAPLKGFIDGFRHIGHEITNEMARKPMGLLKIDHTRAIADMLEADISEEEIQTAYRVFEETLFSNIASHCDLKDHVLEVVANVREMGIKIGSTTGYTSQMMKAVAPKVAEQGYRPDLYVTPDEVPKGRPYPYMIWKNLMEFGVFDTREVVKIGDTLADIEEGKNAGCWTVGVVMGSSELGLTRDEVAALSSEELDARKKQVYQGYYQAGADYIIDDLSELPSVIEDVNRKLAQNAAYKLLTPGPLTTKDSVRRAMLTDHCTWDEEYKSITTSVLNDITAISANEDYATVLLQGSGSYAVEAMMNSLSPKEEKLLILANGAYGQRIITMAKTAERDFVSLSFGETEPIDVKAVAETLKADTEIDTVIFVHCETTTGVLNPLKEIVTLAKQAGKKVFVDAMSSFGAYEIDMPKLGIDALASSANKCLEGAPGIGFVIAKKTLLEQNAGTSPSHSLDLYEQYKGLYAGSGKFRFTSPTHVLLSFRQAIDEYQKEGGLSARRARYAENHKILTEGLGELGIQAVVAAEHQSHIITSFALGDLDFDTFYAALKTKGFIIYPGKLTDLPTFRLGNIGDVYPDDMRRLVSVIRDYVQ